MPATINNLIQQSISRFPDRLALKERDKREWKTLSYRELGEAVAELGTGLLAGGIKPGDKVGLFMNRGCNWLIADLAVLGVRAVDVPRGREIVLDELSFIARHAEVKSVITDMDPEAIAVLRKEAPCIESVIHTGKEKSSGISEVISWEELRNRGRALISGGDGSFCERSESAPENDLATVVYTSGTTAHPKGVMLTQRNIAKDVLSILDRISVMPEDRFLSLLPPYHMFERIIEYVALANGASICFSDLHNLRKDLLAQRPSIVAGVPRMWEMIYHGVMENLKKKGPHKALNLLIEAGKGFIWSKRLILGQSISSPVRVEWPAMPRLKSLAECVLNAPLYFLADCLIFSEVRKSLGGNLRIAVSGGGRLPAHIDDFFEITGITLLNGYGLTETSPVLTLRRPEANIKGTVGTPIMETEIRICDERGEEVPAGESGIVWARGPQVMSGYLKDQEATDKVLKGGWFNTGDIGRQSPHGDLILTGRAKDTIVLLGGENVEPEPIEGTLGLSPYISQAMVVGQDRKSLGALIVPQMRSLEDYARGRGIEYRNAKDLTECPEVIRLMKEEINRLHNKEETTRPWEKIAKFSLIPEEWTVAGGLLTFTLKKKRPAIAKACQHIIERLYK
ncbi:MAG: AMP-binding protein [Pseudomonadota bacterium]